MRDGRQDGTRDSREARKGSREACYRIKASLFASTDSHGFLLKVTSGYLAEGPLSRSLSCPRKYLSKNASV